MDSIKIKVLGTFDILVNDESVIAYVGKTKKGCTLLQYLLLHRDRPVPYSELYDILWLNEDRINPESALKTLMSRLRNILNKCSKDLSTCILTVRGTYQWNNDFPFMLDEIDFVRLCDSLKDNHELTDQAREKYQSVVSLYKGELFSKAAQESWAISQGIHLRNMYEETVYQYLLLLKEKEGV